MEIKEEYIVCLAIHKPNEVVLGGQELIYCGLRHANVLWQGEHISRNPEHQGFLTSRNRFVNRKEAAEIALACGQIEKLKYFADELDSSDLFTQSFWKYNEKRTIPTVDKSEREELILGITSKASKGPKNKPIIFNSISEGLKYFSKFNRKRYD